MNPLVSVVMPVYNTGPYLAPAIGSILSQTFSDFEFIIIDDGSTDSSAAEIDSFASLDGRIRAYHQENQGVTEALNRGCRLALGKYIARMDADDVSFPQRLEREVGYLETHPEIGIVGSWVECINERGEAMGIRKFPVIPTVIAWRLLFENCVAHSTVLMRRSIIELLGLYHGELCEDYALWCRASHITRVANLPEVLGKYRLWDGGVTSEKTQAVEGAAVFIAKVNIEHLLGHLVALYNVKQIRKIGRHFDSIVQAGVAYRLLNELYRAYMKREREKAKTAKRLRSTNFLTFGERTTLAMDKLHLLVDLVYTGVRR